MAIPATGPLAKGWLEWLRRHCTIARHASHLRKQCDENLLRALQGCAVAELPEDD